MVIISPPKGILKENNHLGEKHRYFFFSNFSLFCMPEGTVTLPENPRPPAPPKVIHRLSTGYPQKQESCQKLSTKLFTGNMTINPLAVTGKTGGLGVSMLVDTCGTTQDKPLYKLTVLTQ